MYRLKNIEFQGKTIPILCQNENGPCPLLAISNVLLLQSKIKIHPDLGSIELQHLMQIVANFIIESSNLSKFDEALRVQQQAQIEYVIDLLPRLQHGLDINIKFSDVNQFEFTQELSAFDAFDIALFHGWIPEYEHTVAIVKDLSYNHVLLKIVDYHTLLESKGEEYKGDSCRKITEEGTVLEAFMSETASQLTFAGISGVLQAMKEHQLAVFFRNNHFSTLFKHDGLLYLLVTDYGYADVPSVVWERLDDVGGDTEFCDSNFVTVAPQSQSDAFDPVLVEDTLAPPLRGSEGTDADYLLALQLHKHELGEEDAASNQLRVQLEQEDADRSYALAIQQQEEESARRRASGGRGSGGGGGGRGMVGRGRGNGSNGGRGLTPRNSGPTVAGVTDMGQAIGVPSAGPSTTTNPQRIATSTTRATPTNENRRNSVCKVS